MQYNLNILKGIHPGAIVERELQQHKFSKRKFAFSIGEHPQTLSAIIKGRRDMNTQLSLKIENALSLEEGFLMTLQVFYSIKKIKNSENTYPDITKFRSALFWDTDIKKINWQQQKRAVIKRIFERGNDLEKEEIKKFYGENTINQVLMASKII